MLHKTVDQEQLWDGHVVGDRIRTFKRLMYNPGDFFEIAIPLTLGTIRFYVRGDEKDELCAFSCAFLLARSSGYGKWLTGNNLERSTWDRKLFETEDKLRKCT